MIRILVSTLLVFAGLSTAVAQDRKKETAKNDNEGKKGTVTGIVTAKDKNWIEVKADGEEKARRYVPHWKGGAPKDGGGPDKATIELIAKVPVKARIRLEWSFEERARIDKIEVLKTEKKE